MADESVSNGIKLELKPSRTEYKAGKELPDFEAVITNVSNRNINFCKYYLKYRLLNTLMGEGYEVFYFGSTPRVGLKPEDFEILRPGDRITVPLSIKDEPGFRMLRARDLPPYFNEKFGVEGLEPGNYTFQVFLSNWVLFFGAPEGMHNFTRADVNIKENAPFEDVNADVETMWDGECTAKCRVIFT